jgi:hypothetical protein
MTGHHTDEFLYDAPLPHALTSLPLHATEEATWEEAWEPEDRTGFWTGTRQGSVRLDALDDLEDEPTVPTLAEGRPPLSPRPSVPVSMAPLRDAARPPVLTEPVADTAWSRFTAGFKRLLLGENARD